MKKVAKGYRIIITNKDIIDLETAFQLKVFGYAQTGYKKIRNEKIN